MPHRHDELDRAGAHPRPFGSAALGRLHASRIRIDHVRAAAVVGPGNAAATLVGQNLGAGKPDRAEQAVWRAALYNLVFLGAIGPALRAVRAADRAGLHRPIPRWSRYGVSCLRIVSAGLPVLRLRHGADAGVQRRGRHLDADAGSTSCCFWLLEIPLAWLLAQPLGFGPTGVFVSVLVGFSTMAVVSVVSSAAAGSASKDLRKKAARRNVDRAPAGSSPS